VSRIEQSGRSSLRRPKLPTKGGSEPKEEEEEEKEKEEADKEEEVKNEWNFISTPPIYLHGVDRDIVTFTCIFYWRG